MTARTDEERFRWLAGADSGEPVIEGFAGVFDDYHSFLTDVLVDRVGVDRALFAEETPQDRLEAFRKLVDSAMDLDDDR